MSLRIVSILLISLMLYKPFMSVWAVVDFAIHRDYIANYLCENQDRPELECQGKCFLMQKLKKQAENSRSHQSKQLVQLSKIEIMDIPSTVRFKFSSLIMQFRSDEPAERISIGFLGQIFHPPIAS